MSIRLGRSGGSAGAGYSPIGAAFDALYYRNLYADAGFPRAFNDVHTLTRASTKYAESTTGVWTEFASGIPAITDRGILIEESRTNQIRNNSMQGAVAGSPGTLPTNWSKANSTGLAGEVSSVGVLNGVEYIDFRINGVAAAGDNDIYIETTTQVSALTGENWTFSLFSALVAGSLTNVSSVRLFIIENTAAGAGVVSGAATIVPTATLQRFNYPRTLSGGGTVARVQPVLKVSCSAGAVDLTLRIGWPQLELGAFATSPIRTTSAAATRAADVITIDPKYSSLAQGSAFVEYEPIVLNAGATRVLFNNRVGGSDYIRAVHGSSDAFSFAVVVGGSSQATLNATNILTINTISKQASRWGTDDVAARYSPYLGADPANDTLATMPTGSNTIAVGSFGSAQIINGYLRRLTFYPRKLTDAELGALVA
jgi:hypothetical protein